MRGTQTLAVIAPNWTWFLYVGIDVCMESGTVAYDAVGLTGSWTSRVQDCTSSLTVSPRFTRNCSARM